MEKATNPFMLNMGDLGFAMKTNYFRRILLSSFVVYSTPLKCGSKHFSLHGLANSRKIKSRYANTLHTGDLYRSTEMSSSKPSLYMLVI